MTKIIADCCANHLSDRRLIEQMIKNAASIGVDIVKFQSFKAENLNKNYPDYDYWYRYYKSVELAETDYDFIIDKCKENNIEPLFTVFDTDTADFLYSLELKKVKIASPDGDNWDLIKHCLRKFENVFVSCGMVDDDNRKALFKIPQLTKFYCVSKYPTPISEIDFKEMIWFDGFSDHTLGIEAAKKAIDLGMEYIEKHFTLGRDLPGKDQAMSATLDELRQLVEYRNYKESIKKYKGRWTNE